jgi:hypothetical protein
LLNTPVKVVELPEVIVAAAAVRLVIVGAGTTVSVADCDEPLNVAWICAVALLPTTGVVTLNCTVVCPPGTVTVAGTCAAALSLTRVTESPPVAAGPVRVTVPVVPVPPVTVDKVSAAVCTVGALTVNAPVLATPNVAVMVTGVEELTALVVTWKVAVVAPAATVAVPGTVATVLLLDSVTVAAAAAAPFSVTVPVVEVPPVTGVGFKATDARAGLIEILRIAVAVWEGVAESVTVTVKLKVPNAVGVPESTPPELSTSPAGGVPDVMAQVYGAVPFDAVRVV